MGVSSMRFSRPEKLSRLFIGLLRAFSRSVSSFKLSLDELRPSSKIKSFTDSSYRCISPPDENSNRNIAHSSLLILPLLFQVRKMESKNLKSMFVPCLFLEGFVRSLIVSVSKIHAFISDSLLPVFPSLWWRSPLHQTTGRIPRNFFQDFCFLKTTPPFRSVGV